MFDYYNWRIVPSNLIACLWQMLVLSIVDRRSGV
jgi:hypothetical protein